MGEVNLKGITMNATTTNTNEPRRHKQHLIDVDTYSLDETKEPFGQIYTVDINIPEIRDWLCRIVTWATSNGYGVQVTASKSSVPNFYPRKVTKD